MMVFLGFTGHVFDACFSLFVLDHSGIYLGSYHNAVLWDAWKCIKFAQK